MALALCALPKAITSPLSWHHAAGRYQSALLSLSAAHAALGHPSEALQALNETLRVAQQSGDAWCMLHAMGALARALMLTGGVRPDDVGPQGSGGGKMVGLDMRATQDQLNLMTLCRYVRC